MQHEQARDVRLEAGIRRSFAHGHHRVNVHGRQNDGLFNTRLLSQRLERHPAAHAVPEQRQARRINVQGLGLLLAKSHGAGHVLHAVGKGKVTLTAPRAAVVEIKHVPTRAAHTLGYVEVALVTRKAVQQNQRGVGLRARRRVHERGQPTAVRGNGELCAATRGFGVLSKIGGEVARRGRRLGRRRASDEAH